MNKGNYSTMLEVIANDVRISVAQVETILGAFYNFVARSLKMGRHVVITDFGVFFVKNREVRFKSSKLLLRFLNS